MILSFNSRAEARSERARMVQGPLADPLPALRPLWHDLAAGCLLAAFLFILAWGL